MKISAATWGIKKFNRHHKVGKVSRTYLYLFYTMQTSVLFRKFALGWSSIEMIANTASGTSRAILEQAV